jgi:hypothetical protein
VFTARGEDWPQFRGPGGRAVSETATPPIGFGPSENGGFVYKFEKMVDGRKIFAVGEIKKSECWLISGWYEN